MERMVCGGSGVGRGVGGGVDEREDGGGRWVGEEVGVGIVEDVVVQDLEGDVHCGRSYERHVAGSSAEASLL